jgi:hypothetical protein
LSCSKAGALNGTAVVVLVVGGELVLHGLFGHRFLGHRIVGVRIDQAVHDFVDAQFLALDLVGQLEDLGDRRRAGRDGLDHVLQAVLDALRDLDLALAREELDRPHLAHVHADGVGRAAEFGIEGRDGCLGLLGGIVVRCRRRVLRHQEVSASGASS